MVLVHAPAAPFPPSQAVFARAKLSTNTFEPAPSPITEKDVHKLTAMPHCVAFYNKDEIKGPHDGAMCISACGTQAAPNPQTPAIKPSIEPLGVICDPVLDGAGVFRHPNQLGSVACGIRGMFTITVSANDLRDAAIGDNLYIDEDQTGQADVANSMMGYKLLKYTTQRSVAVGDDLNASASKTVERRLIGRIVGFGHQNEVIVILA